MTKEEYKRLMGYNVTTLFTFMVFHNSLYRKYKGLLYNCYGYNKEVTTPENTLSDDFAYFVFEYTTYLDEDLDNEFNLHPAFISKQYAGDYIVIKVDKWYYMDKKDWELIRNSQYADISGRLLRGIKQLKPTNLVNSIVNKNLLLQQELSEYLEEDITKTNMFWKVFEPQYEVLILSEITEMTMMTYSKDWILKEIKNASIADKIVYQNVLANSTECTTPQIISLGHEPKETKYPTDFTYLHEKLQNKLVELVGKKQYRIEIKGTKYSFLPNATDLSTKLVKVCKKYNLTDINKVEKCLMAHLSKLKAPLLDYYIMKDNISRLAADYETWDDENAEVKRVVIDAKKAFSNG